MQSKEISDKKIWNEFIDGVKPNTFLHTWEWSEFEASLDRKIFRFGVYENNKLIAVSLWSKISARRGTFLLCPHGPIIAKEFENKLEEVVSSIKEKILEVAKEEQCDFIRISTLVVESDENAAVFKKLGFRNAPIHMHSELAWIVDVTQSEEEILKDMKKNTRYSVRKAEKDGVEIVKSDSMTDFETFWDIYITTAKRQHFTPVLI
jgi:peptidoglycan pentaglycine glycine transferase (the first glycine)